MAGTQIISTIFTVAHSITQQVFSVDKIHIFSHLNMQPSYITALEYIFAHIYCFSYGEKDKCKDWNYYFVNLFICSLRKREEYIEKSIKSIIPNRKTHPQSEDIIGENN